MAVSAKYLGNFRCNPSSQSYNFNLILITLIAFLLNY